MPISWRHEVSSSPEAITFIIITPGRSLHLIATFSGPPPLQSFSQLQSVPCPLVFFPLSPEIRVHRRRPVGPLSVGPEVVSCGTRRKGKESILPLSRSLRPLIPSYRSLFCLSPQLKDVSLSLNSQFRGEAGRAGRLQYEWKPARPSGAQGICEKRAGRIL